MHRASWILATLALLGLPLQAQWRVGLGVAREHATGFGRGLPPDDGNSFIPWSPFSWTLRAETPGPGWRGTLELRSSHPDLALTGPLGTFIAHEEDAIGILTLKSSVSRNLVRLTDGVALRGEAGPLVERWSFLGEDPRWVLGPEAGLGMEIRLGGRFTGLISGTGSVLPRSPFREFLPEGFEPRAGWRWGLRAVVLFDVSGG